jgi:homoserine kinase
VSRRVHVRVPATSANLGPGFDALGLALSLYNEVEASPAAATTVSIEGAGAGRLPTNEKNVVVRAIRLAYEAVGHVAEGWTVRCVNRIPSARGLGSSAAAWVGGLAAGNALLGSPLDRAALLRLAARAEGHPDNVAAAVYGGLTVVGGEGDGVVALTLPVPSSLVWVVLVPDMTSATAEARAVLPATVPRADAVFNVQRVALLLASLQQGRLDMLGAALDDRLHQPYRRRLFPWMPAVADAARQAGALGCVLSGAGPSLLAITARADVSQAVAAAMENALAQAGVGGTARVLGVDTEGVVVVEHAA